MVVDEVGTATGPLMKRPKASVDGNAPAAKSAAASEPSCTFSPVTALFAIFAPVTALAAIFAAPTALLAIFAATTALFLIFALVTALFLSCAVPTLFFGGAASLLRRSRLREREAARCRRRPWQAPACGSFEARPLLSSD